MIVTISNRNAGVMGLPAADHVDSMCGRQSKKATVLAADGDQKARKQFLAILDRTGFDGVVAGNGQEAADQFLKRSFDIVFTALKMPGMGGVNLSLQIKALSVNTPVVLMLDVQPENIMNRIKAGRIDCVMTKPISIGKIWKTVQYFAANR